jgi:MFS family permease
VRTGQPTGYLLFALACDVAISGHGLPGVGLLALTAGAAATLVRTAEGSLVASMAGEEQRGTAFGIVTAVNAVGDVTSSLTAGILWSVYGAPVVFAYGTVVGVAGALLLMVLTIPRR